MNEQGVHVDPTKIQFIHYWSTLNKMTELHNFLGLTNFYQQFVMGFSHIARALIQVTKGGVKAKFAGSPPQHKSF